MTDKELNNDHSSVKSASQSIVGGEISKSYARYQLNSDNHSPTASQKTGHHTFQSPSTPKPASSKGAKKVKPPSPRGGWGPDDDSKSMVSLQSERFRRHSIAGSSVRDDESLASSPAVPSYMVATKSARAKTRLQSPLGSEKNGTPEKGSFGTPEKGSFGPAKKRLSFPTSPARPRRHSGPPKVDVSRNAENNTSNGVGSWSFLVKIKGKKLIGFGFGELLEENRNNGLFDLWIHYFLKSFNLLLLNSCSCGVTFFIYFYFFLSPSFGFCMSWW
jgi:hypothetical protein